MKSEKLMVILAISFILFSASYNWTQQSPDEKTMMENWMKYATPGKPHQFLAMQEGEWEVVVKMWMRPGAPPNESKGMANGKMILGGRYLQLQHHGMMMGMHFEGITIGAYDNHLMTFISIWIDNMGTGVFQSMGSLDNTGKTLIEMGEMFDPMTGNNLKMKTVTTYNGNEKFIKVMYHTMPDGQEFKSMEMVYTRKK